MKIKSDIEKFKEVSVVPSNPGSKLEDVYEWKTTDNGSLVYVKTGERNIDEYIQAGRDTADMAIIIERIKNGETNLLNVNPGRFGDISEFPNDFNTAYQQTNAIQDKFNSLDPKVKEVFGNDYNKFVESVMNNTIDSLLAKQNEVKEEKTDVKE